MKLWSGRFSKDTNKLVDDYNASISFDYQLADYDIEGSLAHATMLGKCGHLSSEEVDSIKEGLLRIRAKIKLGEVLFQSSQEDIHMNIEYLLHEEIGIVAGKLHLGRSRNDQIALDMHLFLRAQIIQLTHQIYDFLKVLLHIAAANVDTVVPGYTHLQHAEPIRFAHHILAYFNMFYRDIERLCDSFSRVNKNPLGAGALAGSGIAVDRELVTELLKFDGLYANSLDAVSDRDFIVEFLSNASLIMMHLSRLSEEMLLWCTQEFSFIQLDDAFCTGSSMMPQKKNPDVCELARAKTGRVYGALIGILTVLKGLPLAYNKDLQEDKEGLFDTIKTLKQTFNVYTPMLASMSVNKENMRKATQNDYANATNLANYLTSYGIPFRAAHEITGKIVLHCIENKLSLNELPLPIYQSFSQKINEDVYGILEVEAVIEAHKSYGGTSKHSVERQLEENQIQLDNILTWLNQYTHLT